jgi:hypothetical protein
VAKNSLYDYQNVFGPMVRPFIGLKYHGDVFLMELEKLVLATTPYQARLVEMIIKTLRGVPVFQSGLLSSLRKCCSGALSAAIWATGRLLS